MSIKLAVYGFLLGVMTVTTSAAERTPEISQRDLLSRLDARETLLVLDVRTHDEYAESHVPGALNVDYQQLAGRLNDLTGHRDKTVVVYCESGRRAAIAEKILSDAGFRNLLHLEGDMSGWRYANLPTE